MEQVAVEKVRSFVSCFSQDLCRSKLTVSSYLVHCSTHRQTVVDCGRGHGCSSVHTIIGDMITDTHTCMPENLMATSCNKNGNFVLLGGGCVTT